LIVECHQIAQADDFKVRIVREDRKTHRTPTKVSGVSPEFRWLVQGAVRTTVPPSSTRCAGTGFGASCWAVARRRTDDDCLRFGFGFLIPITGERRRGGDTKG
jgi:hypothetical protein